MTPDLLAAFWLVSLMMVMTPGADWAYAISAGMRQRAVVPAVSGMLLGYLTITLVVAAGVGALVAGAPRVLSGLTLLGAAYLLWLGTSLLVRPPVPAAGTESARSWPATTLRGFAVSGLNPKALLLFLALLPQFIRHDADWPVPAQITALGFVQILNCAVIYSLVALGANLVLRSRPTAARRVARCSGVAMILIALLLVADEARSLAGPLLARVAFP